MTGSLAFVDYETRPAGDILDRHLVSDRRYRQREQRKLTFDTRLSAGLKIEASSPELPAPVQAAIDRLRELEGLEAGWDSYGGRPLNNGAVAPALQLILDGWQTCNNPRIHLNGRGGIDLFWDAGDRSIEISVDPDSMCEVYFEDRATGGEFAPDDRITLEEARQALRLYCHQ